MAKPARSPSGRLVHWRELHQELALQETQLEEFARRVGVARSGRRRGRPRSDSTRSRSRRKGGRGRRWEPASARQEALTTHQSGRGRPERELRTRPAPTNCVPYSRRSGRGRPDPCEPDAVGQVLDSRRSPTIFPAPGSRSDPKSDRSVRRARWTDPSLLPTRLTSCAPASAHDRRPRLRGWRRRHRRLWPLTSSRRRSWRLEPTAPTPRKRSWRRRSPRTLRRPIVDHRARPTWSSRGDRWSPSIASTFGIDRRLERRRRAPPWSRYDPAITLWVIALLIHGQTRST